MGIINSAPESIRNLQELFFGSNCGAPNSAITRWLNHPQITPEDLGINSTEEARVRIEQQFGSIPQVIGWWTWKATATRSHETPTVSLQFVLLKESWSDSNFSHPTDVASCYTFLVWSLTRAQLLTGAPDLPGSSYRLVPDILRLTSLGMVSRNGSLNPDTHTISEIVRELSSRAAEAMVNQSFRWLNPNLEFIGDPNFPVGYHRRYPRTYGAHGLGWIHPSIWTRALNTIVKNFEIEISGMFLNLSHKRFYRVAVNVSNMIRINQTFCCCFEISFDCV